MLLFLSTGRWLLSVRYCRMFHKTVQQHVWGVVQAFIQIK